MKKTMKPLEAVGWLSGSGYQIYTHRAASKVADARSGKSVVFTTFIRSVAAKKKKKY